MDIRKSSSTTLATFFDDTTNFSINNYINLSVYYLQDHLKLIDIWSKNWMVKINENKSSQVTFVFRSDYFSEIKLKNKIIPVKKT
jgi:hypothetical protein